MIIIMDIYKNKKTPHLILQKKKIYRLMQIIVVYFLYHIRPKKAIAQVILKIKTADCTNVLVLHRQYCCKS